MNQTPPPCPKCRMENTYQDGELFICPDCAHEWPVAVPAAESEVDSDALVVKDANGNVLADGDTVVLIKDLKVKGSSSTIKGGTKIKNIRLVSGPAGHNIDCKVDGTPYILKSEFMRKA